MAIDLMPDDLADIKQRMDVANKESHFVILLSIEKSTGASLHLITDYASYREIKREHMNDADIYIVQDIVPITDNIAKWAVAENIAASKDADDGVLADLEHYTNAVLAENGFEANT